MIAGTFVGALSDKYGRRNMSIAFAVSYFIAALTKLSPDFNTLMVGRFLSGIATSLLFSAFEAWMVSEHHNRGFAASLLEETFAMATLGNGVVAVSAGLVAGQAADMWGYVAPFIVTLLPLAAVGVIVFFTWAENYGDAKLDLVGTFSGAWQTIRADSRIFYLGAAQSAFEGAMYTFVFMWTPALAEDGDMDTLPFGTIFAVFMVCSMIGSSVFSLLIKNAKVETIPHSVFAPAALAMFCTAFFIESKARRFLPRAARAGADIVCCADARVLLLPRV
jgi:MFS family permease